MAAAMTQDFKMAGLKQYMTRKTDALGSDSMFDALGLEACKPKAPPSPADMAKLRMSLLQKAPKDSKARFFENNFPVREAEAVQAEVFVSASESSFSSLALESTLHKKQQKKQRRMAARAAQAEEEAAAAAFAKLKIASQPAYIVVPSSRSYGALSGGYFSAATTQDTLDRLSERTSENASESD
mmetsp:Transcript_71483/g.126265  ORF Transcript_71483/g.126265 Transcript_71483/m.126265 type:complete len:184 (+) Transcript_71483:91-642(+)|eukprot:CAMPEP_0197661788 /NCGR_PEP_ID=MMETSP1338-20131121/51671_1 /TAXON_ID=43686 ORGANISM="Pelagodinium beii, Strain RCC1491" /NCGR_SAMPLE_ID=MMETSP1338 /ASSEMBLY_ACC=CAM_ASM_000754 /LENGTH=183 /DNA_ID=CAMNT_0043239417 /DNA_START=69 /DNA_END=620 /DNA_ORIENTATION=-